MGHKFYDKDREGKFWPTIELDMTEVFDQYLSSMDEIDIEFFIEKWMGHKAFLDISIKYLTEAFSSSNCETDTTEARAKLLEKLVGNRIGVAADAAAQSMRQKWYYEQKYWQMYHGMSRFLDGMSREDARRWNLFFDEFKEQNPSPEIGSAEWSAYSKKAHEDVLEIIRKKVDDV